MHTHRYYHSYTGFSGRNSFDVFCCQIIIIAKSTISQAITWINRTPQLPVAH